MKRRRSDLAGPWRYSTTGAQPPRVVDRWTGGSGYLIGGRLVLTVAHNVDYRQVLGEDEQLLVRTIEGSKLAARVVLVSDELSGVDLALLEVSDPRFDEHLPPVSFARVNRDSPMPVSGCWAVGFPRFGEAGPVLPGGSRRETWHVRGDILPGGKLRAGLLSLQVTSTPQTLSATLGRSEWEGMSGAVVFANDSPDSDRAIGVISTHHLPEGESALTVVPITAVGRLPAGEQWWHQFGVPEPGTLPDLPRQASAVAEQRRPRLAGARAATSPDSPYQAPPLGDSYVERTQVLGDLNSRLLPSPQGPGRRVTRAVLYGPPGSGKSTIASAFAHDEKVFAAFPDGILWLSLGETPDLVRGLTGWGRAIADPQLPEQGYPDLETAVDRLRSLMRDHAYLLVVDDAWMSAHIEQGFLLGGPGCLLLVTTRDGRIASRIGAERIELTPMAEKESIELMSRWAGPISQADEPIARTLAQEVGYLPLALELIGARVSTLASWPAYQERWKEQRTQALARNRGARGKQDSVRDSLELSLKLLSDDDRQRYISLGVFARKKLFPASAAATLWNCDRWEAADLLIDLAGQAILSQQETESGIQFGFHDLIYDFILAQLGSSGVLRAHETLLEHYRRDHADWPSVPDDGYFLNNLSYHLIEANRGNELIQLLISSPAWMNAKVAALGSDSSLALDVDRALGLDVDQAQIVALYAVKQAVRERLDWLTDTDLGTLVWQGRAASALSQARMRPNPETRVGALSPSIRSSGPAVPQDPNCLTRRRRWHGRLTRERPGPQRCRQWAYCTFPLMIPVGSRSLKKHATVQIRRRGHRLGAWHC